VELNLGIPVGGISKNITSPKYKTSSSIISCILTPTAELPMLQGMVHTVTNAIYNINQNTLLHPVSAENGTKSGSV
jgi:hypothetical protein